MRASGYNPYYFIDSDPDLSHVVHQIAQGAFSPDEPDRYHGLMHNGDFYQRYADFRSYVDTQTRVDELYRDERAWYRAALINIANMGYFSSDRSIEDYCREIWHIKPLTEKELPPNGR